LEDLFDIFDEYGIENCVITLIKNFKCNDINELRERERFYIKLLDCVNKNIPTRTLKEYYIDNQEHIKETSKKTYELNKNEIFECKCGSVVQKPGKYRHLKKHCKLIFNDE
jgi:ribosome-interacting GTPase 1